MKEVILPVLLEMARLIAAPVYLSWVLCFYRRLHADGCLVLVLLLMFSMVLTSIPVLLVQQAHEGNGVVYAYAALALYTAYWAIGRYVEDLWKDAKD